MQCVQFFHQEALEIGLIAAQIGRRDLDDDELLGLGVDREIDVAAARAMHLPDDAIAVEFHACFEERRGKLYGFRWRDRLDHSSAAPGAGVSPTDQAIGIGDGVTANFQLSKTYGSAYAPYQRVIVKPVTGSVRVAVNGTEAEEGEAFTVDSTSGQVTFLAGHIPPPGAAITAGFLFDVPVRFDTDYLEVDLSAFAAGAIPKLPLVEIRP